MQDTWYTFRENLILLFHFSFFFNRKLIQIFTWWGSQRFEGLFFFLRISPRVKCKALLREHEMGMQHWKRNQTRVQKGVCDIWKGKMDALELRSVPLQKGLKESHEIIDDISPCRILKTLKKRWSSSPRKYSWKRGINYSISQGNIQPSLE